MRQRNLWPEPPTRPNKSSSRWSIISTSQFCHIGLTASLLLACAQVATAATTANSNATVDKQLIAGLSQQPQSVSKEQKRQYRSPWVNSSGLKDNGRYMLGTIANAQSFGIEPERLHAAELSELLGVPPRRLASAVNISQHKPHNLLKVDQLLTSAFKLLVEEIKNGRVSPSESQRYWFAEHKTVNADDWWELLQLQPGSLQQIIAELAQENREIRPLLVELKRLQAIDKSGGWPEIPKGPTIEPGDDSMRVSVLRSRLSTSGDYDPASSNGSTSVYDASLQDAVTRFQARHGLVTDGLVGPATLAALNKSVQQRIDQIQVNIERQRWMPESFGDRYIVTNIPDYRLQVVNGGKTTLEMPVVVGKRKHMTPVFSAEMDHIVVNPTWTVPRSITNNELVPNERANPGYLQAKGYNLLTSDGSKVSYDSLSPDVWNQEKFPYTIRQPAGKSNALGKVKFMFPNRHSIYLHDTPAKKLFAKNKRAFSHGCVRVGEPRELANHLLAQEGWDSEKIDNLFAKTRTKRINLSRPIQNHIVYITSWVDEHGVLQFREDIYGQDKRVAKALQAESEQRYALINDFRELQPVVFAEQVEQ